MSPQRACESVHLDTALSGGNDTEGSQDFVCRGYYSCDKAEVTDVSLCSGAKSCDSISMNVTESIDCAADGACPTAWLYGNGGDIVCDGYRGVCCFVMLLKVLRDGTL